MINVAVLGYGTVGKGVVEVIEKNKDMVNKKSAADLSVKYILDLLDFPEDPYADKIIHDFDTILQDDSVAIICETMGGLRAAYQFTKAALEKGKSVCTSNKELVAKYGPELLATAKENNCNYLFEASVGGGIPIIRPLNYSLTAERIEQITGILNGTTNYILTKMDFENADFDTVLKEAQALGYAEANPEADVEGHDARRKIAILASLMMGKNVDADQIYTEGITKISADDFAYAHACNMTIKLLASGKALGEDAVYAMVAPAMLSKEHPLAMVNDVYNAVFVTGNMLGDSMYYGRGAGALPTASAVVSDVVDCARHIGKVIMCFWDKEDAKIVSVQETKRSFFVRAKAEKMEAIKAAFPNAKIVTVDGRTSDFGLFTEEMKEQEFIQKRESLKDAVLNAIRLY